MLQEQQESRTNATEELTLDKAATGMGVDASGGPVIDPTANVLSLVTAAVKRLDNIAELRDRHLKEVMVLRAEYQEKLAEAESKRIDSNRAVDLGSVAIANERAVQQASIIAKQVESANEVNRAMFASQDTRMAARIQELESKLSDRIYKLEQLSWVGSGRQAVSDPMLTELVREMKTIRENGEVRKGSSAGSASMWAYLVGAFGAVAAGTGLIILIIHMAVK